MSSSALIDNRLFNKLIANKLVAQEIKTDETFPLTPQYLFSVLFNSNAKFERISDTTGHLIFSNADITSTTRFSDRPLRKTDDISAEDFLSYFTTTVGPDTFRDDPPNAVLVHNEEQRVYTVSNLQKNGSEYRFEMTTLPDETHTAMSTVSGPFSLFVDGVTDTTTTDTGTTDTVSYVAEWAYDPVFVLQTIILVSSNGNKYDSATTANAEQYNTVYTTEITINVNLNGTYTNTGWFNIENPNITTIKFYDANGTLHYFYKFSNNSNTSFYKYNGTYNTYSGATITITNITDQ